MHPLGAAEAAALEALAAATPPPLLFVEGAGALRLRELRPHGSGWVLFLGGVRRLERARELVHARLYAAPEALPAPPEGRAYLDALLGAPLRWAAGGPTPSGPAPGGEDPIGEVVEVRPGAQDLLVVAAFGADGRPDGREWLLPLQAPYVRFDGERVWLDDPPAGLLE